MKKHQLSTLILVFGILLTLTNCSKSDFMLQEENKNNVLLSKSKKNIKSSVSGQGGLSFGEGTKTQHFSFHASIDQNGNVFGSFESKSPSQNSVRTHGTIDCVTFIDDKTAVLSGTITKVVKGNEGTFSNFIVGASVWFKVIDNGEGANSDSDQFSDYYAGFGGCTLYNVRMKDIETGNIQVKR